jgi:hypothetical protein
VAGHEHVAEGREDPLAASALERKLLGVTFDPLDLEALGRGLLPTTLEGLGRKVEAGHAGIGARGGDGDIAGPACDVEDTHARLDVRATYDEFANMGDVRG